jgi:ABC-type phosphate transport system substrate-binding protein
MTSPRLFSVFKPRLHGDFYMHAFVAAWFIVSATLIFWPEPANAGNTILVPYSVSKQYTHLTRDDLREIFFGRRTRWPDGSPLRVFVLPDHDPLHIRFSKEVLGVYPYQLRSVWDRMVYSGTGVPPTMVESLEKMKTIIKETPDAIGYIEQ